MGTLAAVSIITSATVTGIGLHQTAHVLVTFVVNTTKELINQISIDRQALACLEAFEAAVEFIGKRPCSSTLNCPATLTTSIFA